VAENRGRALDAQRAIANLKELRDLTGDAGGAQRVAFTETWGVARTWFRDKLSGLPVHWEQDEAGNTWVTLPGDSSRELIIGSHLDSVPNGGWLDGALGVIAGLEVLRRVASEGTPPVTLRLVDWADEEGARFGRSLFGSSAVSGSLEPDLVRGLTDKKGMRLEDAVAAYGIEMDRIDAAAKRLDNAAAYLELHIEQGPVLEALNYPLGVVLGTVGIERHAVRFWGQTSHAGSTPMNLRRDALIAASRLTLEVRDVAERHGGVGTVGSCMARPGIPTAIPGQCQVTVDLRHLEAWNLAAMLEDLREAAEHIADDERVDVTWSPLWRIEPITFHPDLIELADQALWDTVGETHRLPSGPLHDAAEMSRAGVPTVMLFVQSLRGLSHTSEEDTREEHLLLAVEALDRLASKTIDWIRARR